MVFNCWCPHLSVDCCLGVFIFSCYFYYYFLLFSPLTSSSSFMLLLFYGKGDVEMRGIRGVHCLLKYLASDIIRQTTDAGNANPPISPHDNLAQKYYYIFK